MTPRVCVHDAGGTDGNADADANTGGHIGGAGVAPLSRETLNGKSR